MFPGICKSKPPKNFTESLLVEDGTDPCLLTLSTKSIALIIFLSYINKKNEELFRVLGV